MIEDDDDEEFDDNQATIINMWFVRGWGDRNRCEGKASFLLDKR